MHIISQLEKISFVNIEEKISLWQKWSTDMILRKNPVKFCKSGQTQREITSTASGTSCRTECPCPAGSWRLGLGRWPSSRCRPSLSVSRSLTICSPQRKPNPTHSFRRGRAPQTSTVRETMTAGTMMMRTLISPLLWDSQELRKIPAQKVVRSRALEPLEARRSLLSRKIYYPPWAWLGYILSDIDSLSRSEWLEEERP